MPDTTTLPLGIAVAPGRDGPGVVVRVGADVVWLHALADAGLLPPGPWRAPTLNAFLASGRDNWRRTRETLGALVDRETVPEAATTAAGDVAMQLPVAIGDYVDFYASEHHATAIGRLLRPGDPPLPPNWKHLPIGYHGRTGTIVVSGTPVRRPHGQRRLAPDQPPTFGPTERLDVETEIGYVVGVPSTHGVPVPVDGFAAHVFGVCLVNDWSARDVQAWEYQPLGPFLGKSFATSVSPWLVPLDALEHARVPAQSADVPLLPYLRETQPWNLDVTLELRVNGELLSRPPGATMFWSPAQMLAHLTVNGASVRTGDLYASGTVSGPDADQAGSLMELYRAERFLTDGDEVVISASAPGVDGTRVDLDAVAGTVLPSR